MDSVEQESSAPVTFWRSVGNSHNGFVVESFVDEVAHSLGADPYQFRLQHLKNDPRAAAVVEKAAELSSWKSYPKSGKKALGFAYHFSFNTHCAEIAEVEVVNGGAELIRIVDDGEGIHPDDLLLAVSSHATSKISTMQELEEVTTLGFRGEALPSIASVANLTLTSRASGQTAAWRLQPDSHGESKADSIPAAHPPGSPSRNPAR